MKLCLVGHSHRYSIEQAVVGLLGRKAVFCESIPEDDVGDILISKLSYGEKYATAKAELRLDGRRYIESAKADLSGLQTEDDRIRLEQHALKLAVFKAIRKATGEEYPWGSLTGMRPSKLALRMLEDGYTPALARRLLTDRYLLEPERAKLVVEAAGCGFRTKRRFGARDISLYVGIPFCPTRCAYCSFVSSETGKSGHLIEPYLERLFEEIRIRGGLIRELGLDVRTIYIGGGTPTSLSALQLDRLMDILRREIPLGGVLEYTVEAGRPDTITAEKLRVLKENGAGRISINPQSMVREVLDRCARPHSPEDVRAAYALAREIGFDCINMDTIAGLPGDTPAGFQSTITELVSLAPENISVHTLALKRGAELKNSEASGASAQEVQSMLDFSMDLLYNNGYKPYYLYRQKYMAASLENTGWTVEGKESLYNICIMEEFQTILSLGAGGVTKLVDEGGGRIERIANNKYPKEYIGSADKITADGDRIRRFYSEGSGTLQKSE
jgi:oxygen-independent coproporphyrinogen-3 oxidase